jgi:hypothetical protein
MKDEIKHLEKIIRKYEKALKRIKEIPFTDTAFKELCLNEIQDLEIELKQLHVMGYN